MSYNLIRNIIISVVLCHNCCLFADLQNNDTWQPSLKDLISGFFYKTVGKPLVLDKTMGYDEKIQWLKLYDQTLDHITCTDKLRVREWVADRIGEEYLIPLKDVYSENYPMMIKVNHWSGHTYLVNCYEDKVYALNKLIPVLEKKYGQHKGEWAYSFITPEIFAEEVLKDATDYKFDCVNGVIKCFTVFKNRGSENFQARTFLPDGTPTNYCTFTKAKLGSFDAPDKIIIDSLSQLATKLSQGWRYVRVDLYWSNNHPYFGEMTFWPQSGCTKPDSYGYEFLSEMLEFDTEHRNTPIVR